jgi:hypothetical protein
VGKAWPQRDRQNYQRHNRDEDHPNALQQELQLAIHRLSFDPS